VSGTQWSGLTTASAWQRRAGSAPSPVVLTRWHARLTSTLKYDAFAQIPQGGSGPVHLAARAAGSVELELPPREPHELVNIE
jgi:hypothetical protein